MSYSKGCGQKQNIRFSNFALHRFVSFSMNLSSPAVVKQILAAHGLEPSRSLGQNFLVDENIVKKIVSSANLQPDDNVLEIGPGIGTLTQELAHHVKHVFAVEKAFKMVKILQTTMAQEPNITIVQGDILAFPLPPPPGQQSRVVANLPYYIPAPAIRTSPEAAPRPADLTLVTQKEVAQRICSRPPDMNILAVSVQFYAMPKLLFTIKRSAFWPQPRVDSAVLHITLHSNFSHVASKIFFHIIKTGFSQRGSDLSSEKIRQQIPFSSRDQIAAWLLRNGIQPNQRAETLSMEDWINLTTSIAGTQPHNGK